MSLRSIQARVGSSMFTGGMRGPLTRSLSTLPSAPGAARLQALEDTFKQAVEQHLPATGKGTVFATAWLATDNIIVHLLSRHFPEVLKGMGLLAVDTLHLFPETHLVAAAVQAKYDKVAAGYKPLGVSTRTEFEAKYGHCEVLNHAEFDLHSKVEPYSRGLKDLGKDILVTGRRMDQGEKRVALDLWERLSRILNPMAEWRWDDITRFVDANGVPVNTAHYSVYRANAHIDPKQRHRTDLPWTKVDLGKPFWRATPAELAGSPPANVHYVFKSFGDTHTSVPVEPHQSERTGRFVRTANTECGIHTRAAVAGEPHGRRLVNLTANESKKAALLKNAGDRTMELSDRALCDVELLVNGGFSPLTGFMNKAEYESVVAHGRLPEQQLWPMPVVLDTDDASVAPGQFIALTHNGKKVAVVEVQSVWTPDKAAEAHHVFGTTSLEHPGVYDLAVKRGRFYVGGKVHGLGESFERPMTCASPQEVRAMLPAGKPVVAFQCRNPIHKAHFELIRRVMGDVPGSTVIVHPTVGPTQPGDIDGETRVATYEALAKEKVDPRLIWAFLPFNMRMAGPREAVQHMIVRKNFGATHFIVGRDMAGTKSTRTQDDFYDPYAAQVAAKAAAGELAMQVVTYENMVYVGQGESGYVPESEAKAKGLKAAKLSGTEFRRLLRAGEPIPDWFAFASVIAALRDTELAAKAAAATTASAAAKIKA